MNLDELWAHIFSEEADQVRTAWAGLSSEERVSVQDLLARIVEDEERAAAQRDAAQFALDVITGADIPAGALEFARALARDTALHLKAMFGQITASVKRDGTLVTESDLDSDRRLSQAILARYPAHTILSEERDREYRGQEWSWVIDPIDGTTNFTWGFPIWGVLIGLLHYGEPVLGVAHFPVTDEQFYAAQGRGAWLNGDRIRTAGVDDHSGIARETQLFACCTRTLKLGRPNVPMKIRVPGNTGYDIALVAKGACVGSLDLTVHVWDVAALWPIIHEAGGQVRSNVQDGVFPLRHGVDYGAVDFSLLSAADHPTLTMLEAQLGDRFQFAT
jgi:myo-inositol-1(or 4)-monophosphatase